MRLTVLIFMLYSLFMTSPVSANKLLWNENGVSKHFNSASAKELLTKREYRNFRTLLKDLDCGPAALLLNSAFIKRYPQFSSVAAPRGREFVMWITIYATTEFPDLSFCRDSLGLKTMEMEIAERGLPIGKFVQGNEKKIPSLHRVYRDEWQKRDTFVSGLIFQASRDYVPALHYLAKLVARGDLFNARPEIELYLLSRAYFLGDSSASQNVRMKELETIVSNQKGKKMRQVARQKNIVYELLEKNNIP